MVVMGSHLWLLLTSFFENACTVGKIYTPIFSFFRKRVVNIVTLELGPISNERSRNSIELKKLVAIEKRKYWCINYVHCTSKNVMGEKEG